MYASPAEEQFAVVRFSAEWRVLRNGEDRGHFAYQVDAVEAALRLARKARQAGRVAEVLVQDASGQLDRVDPP
jgi:hypothetical protein